MIDNEIGTIIAVAHQLINRKSYNHCSDVDPSPGWVSNYVCLDMHLLSSSTTSLALISILSMTNNHHYHNSITKSLA